MTTALTTNQDNPTRRHTLGRRGAAVVAGVAVALAGWGLAGPLAGVGLNVRMGSDASATNHVGPGSVLIVSALIGLAAWGLLAALERRSSNGRKTWRRIALVVLIVSLLGPLAAGTTVATKVALVLIHLAVGAALIAGMGRTPTTARRQATPAAGNKSEAIPA